MVLGFAPLDVASRYILVGFDDGHSRFLMH